MLPQQNARITKIERPGRQRQYGQADAAGAVKWSGDAPAYFKESLLTRLGPAGGNLDRPRQSTLYIEANLRPHVDLQPGDHVTFTQVINNVTVTQTRIIDDSTTHPGAPGVRAAVKIGLQRQNVVVT